MGRSNNRRNKSKRGGGRASNSQPQSTEDSNSHKMFSYSTANRNKGPTYQECVDDFCNHVQATYDRGFDIAESLRQGKLIDLNDSKPTMQVDEEGLRGAALSAANRAFDIEYRMDLTRWKDRKEKLLENVTKAYSELLVEWCDDNMRKRVEQHKDFKDKIKNCPFELLKELKPLMTNPVRTEYHYMELVRIMVSMLHFNKQDLEDSNLDYRKRSDHEAARLKEKVGTDWLTILSPRPPSTGP